MLIGITEVARKLGKSRGWLAANMDNLEGFPKPCVAKPAVPKWREEEVDAWISPQAQSKNSKGNYASHQDRV